MFSQFFNFGNNIAVYPDVSVILNAVKDPAQVLSKRLCEILRVAQDDRGVWVNCYIITKTFVTAVEKYCHRDGKALSPR